MSTKLFRDQLVDNRRTYQSPFPIDTDAPAFRALEQWIERSLEQMVARWRPRTRECVGQDGVGRWENE